MSVRPLPNDIRVPLNRSTGPIGVFDSGIGGVSVLPAIRTVLPAEALIYCADTRYNPYGERSEDFVIERSLAIGHWLIGQGAKALVVACNTATTIAIQVMRATFDVPVIGVEPGVKPAVQQSRSGVAGVLATAGTLRSDKFQRLLREYGGNCRLICTPGIGLVEAIESGDFASDVLRARLASYLQPMLDAGADTLALGCTHYPFLIPLIERIAGDRMTIVDNSLPVARQLMRQLDVHGLRAPGADDHAAASAAPMTFFSTGDIAQLQRLARVAVALEHISPTVSAASIPSASAH